MFGTQKHRIGASKKRECVSCVIRRRLSGKLSSPQKGSTNQDSTQTEKSHDYLSLLAALTKLRVCKSCENQKNTLLSRCIVDNDGKDFVKNWLERAHKHYSPQRKSHDKCVKEFATILQVLSELAQTEMQTMNQLRKAQDNALEANRSLTKQNQLHEHELNHSQHTHDDELRELKQKIARLECQNSELSVLVTRNAVSEHEIENFRKRHVEMSEKLESVVERNKFLEMRNQRNVHTEQQMKQENECVISKLRERLAHEQMCRNSAETKAKDAVENARRSSMARCNTLRLNNELTRLHASAVREEEKASKALQVELRKNKMNECEPSKLLPTTTENNGCNSASVEDIIAESLKIRSKFEARSQSLHNKHRVIMQGITLTNK